MKKPIGSLHPLPIPDGQGDSVAMDFIGPLPEDEGFNCIVMMTERMGSDIQIVPTRMDIAAEDFAQLFFDHWYCENGLPLELISDRDKLFVSQFWKALTKITGIKLGMSTAFHPETDGVSEWTNKTVDQCLRYHVTRNQQGWVRALQHVRFAIRNTVNKSTGFSPFQLHTGRSPGMIPPVMADVRGLEDMDAVKVIHQIEADVAEAKDMSRIKSLTSKISHICQEIRDIKTRRKPQSNSSNRSYTNTDLDEGQKDQNYTPEQDSKNSAKEGSNGEDGWGGTYSSHSTLCPHEPSNPDNPSCHAPIPPSPNPLPSESILEPPGDLSPSPASRIATLSPSLLS